MESREPITGKLRRWLRDCCHPYNVDEHGTRTEPTWEGVCDLCDAIDAVHAQLERDYKVACEVNERQDEQYADVVHRLDRAYEKNRNQRRQLTEVQEALHRRNEGELKARWQKEIDRLERENESLRRELDRVLEELDSRGDSMHDADGVPIHLGDVMDGTCPSGKHVNGTVNAIGDGVFWLSNVQFALEPDYMRHHHAPTVEDVLMELLNEAEHFHSLEEERDAIAEYAAKLRLAGDAE